MSPTLSETARVMVAQGRLTQAQYDQLFGEKKDGASGGGTEPTENCPQPSVEVNRAFGGAHSAGSEPASARHILTGQDKAAGERDEPEPVQFPDDDIPF